MKIGFSMTRGENVIKNKENISVRIFKGISVCFQMKEISAYVDLILFYAIYDISS